MCDRNYCAKYTFVCRRCTACCRWPGEVRLTDNEISDLALFFKLSETDFIQRYTRLNKNRQGLALQEKDNGDCIFLEGKDCIVQSVKPQQCRDFPNTWSFPEFQKECRAEKVDRVQSLAANSCK